MKKLLGTILLFFVIFSFINPAQSFASGSGGPLRDNYNDGSVSCLWDSDDFNGSFYDNLLYTVHLACTNNTGQTLTQVQIGGNDNPTINWTGGTGSPDNGFSATDTSNMFGILADGDTLHFSIDITFHSNISYATFGFYNGDQSNHWVPALDSGGDFPTPTPTEGNPFSANIDPSQQAQVNGAIGSIPTTAMQEWLSILLESLPWLLVMMVVIIAYAWIKYFMKKSKRK